MEKTGIGLLSNTQKLLKRSIFVISLCGALSGGASNLYASESVFEQNYSLTLTYNNASLEQVLDAISKQAGIKIAYSNDVIVEKQVTVNIKTTDIREALRVVLGDGYTFKQIDDYIAIAKVSKAESTITNKVADDREWTIQGQVMENVEPPMSLPGVNVVIKGTTLGTITDGNGYFSIKAKKGDVLVFKYIGFKDYEYVVSRQISNLSVAMAADSEELDEVIVTGMSEEKRLNSVSAVSTLNVAANLTTKPITSISQSLQGGITGLNVSQSTGLPGADNAVIKIRGISSIKTNNDPLVLVDGIPMDMNQLDPNTIESMTVLKDAAAAAMYGARTANGVIVVKTKRGMPGKVNVSYNGYVGVQKATYLPEFVDGATFMEMTNMAQQNIGGDPTYSQEAIDATRNGTDPIKYPNTDWADYMFKNGFIQNHSVGVCIRWW